MTYIIFYFILGMVFLSVLPILDSLVNLILTFFELLKAKMSIKITEYGCQIAKLQSDMEEECSCLPQSSTHAIGFSIPTEEEDESY